MDYMEYRMTVLVKVYTNGDHVFSCPQCDQLIRHNCEHEKLQTSSSAVSVQKPSTSKHDSAVREITKRNDAMNRRSVSAVRALEILNCPDFQLSPRKKHVKCNPCGKSVISIEKTKTIQESKQNRHIKGPKHQAAKATQSSFVHPRKQSTAAMLPSSITKKKNWHAKSIVCPCCNKYVDASFRGPRNHSTTQIHKAAVEKSKLMILISPDSLPVKTRTERLRRCWFKCLAAAGIPVLAGDRFRPFLRQFVTGGAGIPQRQQLMSAEIPEMKASEKKRLIDKYRGKKFSIELDSSPIAKKHFFAVLLIPENSGKGDMVRLEFPKSVTGKYTAETAKSVMEEYELDPANCIAFVGDGASVNHTAFNKYLRSLLPNAKFLFCTAHSWNNVHQVLIKGLPLIEKFMNHVRKLFCHSGARKQKFRDFIEARGTFYASPIFHCKTRWSTYMKCVRYWIRYIEEIEEFVNDLKVSGKVGKCLQKLRAIFNNVDQKLKLLFHLRALDHVADKLEAELTKCETNTLPLAPYVLEATARISSTFEGLLLPNEFDPHVPAEGKTTGWTNKTWYVEGKNELTAAFSAARVKLQSFSKEHPESNFLNGVRVFEPSFAIRMMDGAHWKTMRDIVLPSWGLTGLRRVPEVEWQNYRKIAGEVVFVSVEDLDKFWKSQASELPILHAVALQNIWTPVNSVEVERCFSVINSFFGKKRYQMSEVNTAVLMSFAFNMRRLNDFDLFDESLLVGDFCK